MTEVVQKPRAERANKAEKAVSPIGSTHRAGSSRRAKRSAAYRGELARLAPYEQLARIVMGRRAALGFTQQQLAERVGTSHSVISRIESGQHMTSVTTLQRLAAAFETHLVVGFSDEPDAIADRELVALSLSLEEGR